MCHSAMTVSGLTVLSLSQLQPAQQAFLFILMIIGDIVRFGRFPPLKTVLRCLDDNHCPTVSQEL